MTSARVWEGMLAGLAGGLVASWVMERFQELLSKASDQRQEDEPATVKAASAITRKALDFELSADRKKTAGTIMHYAMGATSGCFYGAAAEIAPRLAAGAGALFGAALWMVADEIVVPALGLSKDPEEYPASTHAQALASHLVYGWTTNAARRVLVRPR